MAIYLLKLIDNRTASSFLGDIDGPLSMYGFYQSKVVRAKDEIGARALANVDYGSEGQVWLDRKKVACEEVTEGDDEVILESFIEE